MIEYYCEITNQEERIHQIDKKYIWEFFLSCFYQLNPLWVLKHFGAYWLKKIEAILVDMYVLRVNHVMAYPNLFNYLEQELAESMLFNVYYNSQYECGYERWQRMIAMERDSKWWKLEHFNIKS